MLRYQEGSARTEAREQGFLEALKAEASRASPSSPPTSTPVRPATPPSASPRTCSTATRICRASSASTSRRPPACCSRCRTSAAPARSRSSASTRTRCSSRRWPRARCRGFVLQDPFDMGYPAVKTMVQHLQGQTVPAMIDTGVHVVTPENIKTPEMEQLLNPPLAKYLPTEPGRRAVLALSGLRKRFGATVALDGVDLDLRAGRGPRADRRERRRQEHADERASPARCAPDARRRCGSTARRTRRVAARRARTPGVALIHQELSLCPHLTVAENILLGLEPRARRLARSQRRAGARRRRAARELLASRDLAPERLVGDLPIAARQVVEICRALAANALVVLMDEPTSSLPRADVERLFALIRRLRRAASPSSTSATSSRRCARSPIATPCCATAAAWPRGALADGHQRAADRAHGRAPDGRAVPRARPGAARGGAASTSSSSRRRRRSAAPLPSCGAARSSGSPA